MSITELIDELRTRESKHLMSLAFLAAAPQYDIETAN